MEREQQVPQRTEFRRRRRHEQVSAPATAKETPERQELPEYVDAVVADTIAKADVMVAASERLQAQVIKDLIKAGCVKEVPQVVKEAKRTKTVLGTLRNKFFKLVPLLLPMVFAAKLKMREPDTEDMSFEHHVVAARQLEQEGITDERRAAYMPVVSDFLYRAITPLGYQSMWDVVRNMPENIFSEEERVQRGRGPLLERMTDAKFKKSEIPEREDAWRLYLGLPQQNHTFGISRFRPEKSHENRYYYRINHWLERCMEPANAGHESNFNPMQRIVHTIDVAPRLHELKRQTVQAYKAYSEANNNLHSFEQSHLDVLARVPHEELPTPIRNELDRLKKENDARFQMQHELNISLDRLQQGTVSHEFVDDLSIIFVDDRANEAGDSRAGIMGNFKISVGEDERGHYISYYDRWDLGANPVEGEEGLLGRPFEIYDRIYYNPSTYEVIESDR